MTGGDRSAPTVRAFVDGRGTDVAVGGTALDAVASLDGDLAALVATGARSLTDSRGLPVALDTPVYGGAIFRVVSGTRTTDAATDAPDEPAEPLSAP